LDGAELHRILCLPKWGRLDSYAEMFAPIAKIDHCHATYGLSQFHILLPPIQDILFKTNVP
jgi:hypothetical protein